MTGPSRQQPVIEELRRRILSGLQLRSLHVGDRLPTVRVLATEFAVNPRVILAACGELEAEGLLVRRGRSGLYVGQPSNRGAVRTPEDSEWITDVFLQAWSRGIPGPQFADYARRSFDRFRLRAVVVECNADQRWSFADDLVQDFGFQAAAIDLDAIPKDAPPPALLAHADCLLTTGEHAQAVRRVGAQLDVPVFVVSMSTILLERMAQGLHTRPAYFVVVDDGFADKLCRLLSTSPHAENFRPLVLGRDNLEHIPDDAVLYVSRLARRQLGESPLLARALPPARVISSEAARDLLSFAASRTGDPAPRSASATPARELVFQRHEVR